MSETTSTIPAAPLRRTCPFSPPPEIADLRAHEPISRARFPSGDVAWLLTRHEDVRFVLRDPRFSIRNRKVLNTPNPPPQPILGRKGLLLSMDPPEHSSYRKQLTAAFTLKRTKTMLPWFEKIVDEHLDRMLGTTPPADLMRELALPLTSLALGELLGVPYADRAEFQETAEDILRLDLTAVQQQAAMDRIDRYVGALIAAKRVNPGDDLLSDLIGSPNEDGLLDDEVLRSFAMLLLIAGHETSAGMIGLGAALLLQHPEQVELLRADQGAADHAVEELLRFVSIVHRGQLRTATEDVELDGKLIKAGDFVVAHLPAANFDEKLADDPGRLDITRKPTPHVAFGFGPHQCLGQQMARMELQVVFRKLFTRIPSLRLAVPVDELPFKDEAVVYGVFELPVAW